jgi:hypothetical protein
MAQKATVSSVSRQRSRVSGMGVSTGLKEGKIIALAAYPIRPSWSIKKLSSKP